VKNRHYTHQRPLPHPSGGALVFLFSCYFADCLPRRGLATNLNRLGIDDSVIQRIMRHSSLAVTQRCYIKTDGTDAESAMRQLSGKLSGACSQPVLKNVVSEPSVTVQ
jgi:hypothetical protein